jgi:hypothetical protein
MTKKGSSERGNVHQAKVEGDVTGQVAVGENITQQVVYQITGFPSLREWFAYLSLVARVLMVGVTLAGFTFVVVLTLAVLPGIIRAAREPNGVIHSILPAPVPTPTPVPPMPRRGFNVAVAEFTPLDETADSALADASQDLSQWLFRFIREKTDELPASYAISVRGPDEIGNVPGEDSDARDDTAAEVANQHNATILIYGVVTDQEDGYYVRPAFLVLEKGFNYGSEVTGPNRLGQQVAFVPPLGDPGTLHDVNVELEARAEALSYLVRGLGHLYVAEYEKAYLEFEDATQVSEWQPDEGQEVAYLMMGAAKLLTSDELKAAQQDAARRLDADDEVAAIQGERARALDEAANAFTGAYQINSRYARSYLGLGTTSLQQATRLNAGATDIESVNQAKLAEAQAWFSGGLNATDQPESAHINVKADYGLGQIHLVGYKFELNGWSATDVRQHLNQVISVYDPENAPELTWYVGAAHALLGNLAYLEEDWPTMAAECRQAIDALGNVPTDSARLQAMIAEADLCVAFAEERLSQSG